MFSTKHNTIKTVEMETQRLASCSKESLIGFGYGGITESCYCFEGKSGSDCVYWFSWEENIKRVEAANFEQWIETKPSQLFLAEIYAGYSKIKNIDRLMAVMDKRAAFKVELKAYDKQLQRPPDGASDFLPRYNRLVFRLEKTRSVGIKIITIKVRRAGSKIGQDNVEYVSIPVDDIPRGKVIERECYAFDPFNLPFERIEIEYNPIIDLGSKMRVRFKELSGLLK